MDVYYSGPRPTFQDPDDASITKTITLQVEPSSSERLWRRKLICCAKAIEQDLVDRRKMIKQEAESSHQTGQAPHLHHQ